MRELWELYKAFFKIGIFTFGGGLSMLPMLEKEIVEKNHWADKEELLNYYAIGQCTPGIIAVNTATFIGYKRKGSIGGIAATLGIISPSLIIIILVASILKNFMEYEIVKHIFSGIRIAVAALVANTVIKLFKSGIKDTLGVIIFLCALSLNLIFDIPIIILVIISILLGIFITYKNKEVVK